MKKLILVTKNQHKVEEISLLLKEVGIEVQGAEEALASIEIPETGNSFEENAEQKVRFLSNLFPNDFLLADDSGLCVDALEGAPGIYSARFGSENLSYPERFLLLREKLEEKKATDWSAKFVCVLALLLPQDVLHQERSCLFFRGEWQGEIAKEARGTEGFGYDPIFYLKEKKMCVSELSKEEKNRLSHRSRAMQALVAFFQKKEVR